MTPFVRPGVSIDQGKFNIFQGSGSIQQVKALEYESQVMAPEKGSLVPAQGADLNILEKVVACCGCVETAKEIQES